MKPRKPFRKTPLRSGGRIRPKKRSKAEFARVYGSTERVEWVKTQPCIVGNMGPWWLHGGEVENAHITTGGIGRKADADQIVPLCHRHHRLLHDRGIKEFCYYTLADLKYEAARTEARWQQYLCSTNATSFGESR